MKNLIKKTIVMLLVVCSLVSTVGVQPVFAQENLPSADNKKAINKSDIPVIERVWANDKVTFISVKMPSKLMKKYKLASSYRVLIEKKVNGKWKKIKTQKVLYGNKEGREYAFYGHGGKIGRAIFGFSQEKKVGEQYRYSVRLYTKNNKKELTKYSKSYKMKIKKNKSKQIQHPNDVSYAYSFDFSNGIISRYDSIKVMAHTYCALLFEESDTKDFNRIRRTIWTEEYNVSRKTYSDIDWAFYSARVYKNKYYRVYGIEFNKNGTLTYYPYGDTYFYDGKKLVNVINPGQDLTRPEQNQPEEPTTDVSVTQ